MRIKFQMGISPLQLNKETIFTLRNPMTPWKKLPKHPIKAGMRFSLTFINGRTISLPIIN